MSFTRSSTRAFATDSVLGTHSIDENGDTSLTDYGVYTLEGGELRFAQTIKGDGMTARYPAGSQCWVELLQADPRRARRFYAALFGWETYAQRGGYSVARVRGRDVAGIGPAGPLAMPGWITRVRVTHVEETVAAARAAGASLIGWPAPGRLALLADPAGAPFAVWQTDAGGAQLVNEPGSWDLSTLRTPAPGQAVAFYGSLFGWHAEPYGAITLWRLHGYSGGLGEQPVPRDTVAIMTAVEGAHARADWGVDFRVRDTDASAERAVRLGAAIVAAPHDTAGFRTAVLADPQGAEFSITRFAG
jgi:uncharacterized protein